ncbi:MAG: bifunctional phosphopantothenoylcysteine decarboxylase/phosphopantothenate--cysteine ligase CoaBC [Xanthomonadales bacterium]|nr:bifunctional phosphopantothenoylcysteine decarboxylase/phosphopantothenate--cysteine ligase CoaBC [Gammaproteobacteria bacterium]MBT8053535.1 bifunctional phosphopantothenoylcysteine decarboxylase/phosphopantothenate--cysteine ligase CoaBC [Gammaproteobacteria bacterium]NND57984.1 bifunctional phosphopantothenoylcysteine decarboxylase/phosphopantothenate--cysteine ligase CoaBC [Xanthomonadales bacterium]NNK50850.1 bifunctional phosphopantothenoylcysteine decarboxylase/phosphopantothenate--cys
MNHKRVLLGVTGGIAAYKSADLVRRLRDAGAEVRVVMTRGATAFVTPLTFQAVSGNPVHTELLDETAEAGMGHIELARWATELLVAPATADFIAKLAHGLADDLLSTVCLATAAPLTLAPAMNQQMWQHPATQANCDLLRERGVQMAGPASGGQACGETGPGRMIEPADLVIALFAGASGPLSGKHVIVTAGPTYEDIDPVRYIGNRSSGKMGFAVAGAAALAGARVSLVSGPVSLATPFGVDRTDVRSALEMRKISLQLAAEADVFISVAAVADYTPEHLAPQKLKKGLSKQKIELVGTPDIVAEVAALANGPFTVGFAAETESLREHAREKLSRKRLDMIAANRVGHSDSGFESDNNEILVLVPGGEIPLGRGSKRQLARLLVDQIAARLNGKQDSATGTNKNTRSAARN